MTLGLLISANPVRGEISTANEDLLNNSPVKQDSKTQFEVFPVGINLNGRNINTSALIKGAEDGIAIAFEKWLIPFDVVVEALNLEVTTLDRGVLELRSPGIVTKVNPKQLLTDRDLGLVFQISQIEDILGVAVEFNLREYAIEFKPPWSNLPQRNAVVDVPVDTTGLTQMNPKNFTLTTVGQRLRWNNNDLGNRNFDSVSEFSAIGTLGGGSWYTQIDGNDLTDLSSWQLGELQYLRQTDTTDYALGSHSTFWQTSANASSGQYWGMTTIRRFGFTPNRNLSLGGFNANLRRQPQAVNRTIAGTAQPGDIVHLVTRRGEIIQEIVVDETGTYQFDDVDSRQNDYQILVYPNGRLTVAPEIREPVTTYVSGQLSRGTSTLSASLGINRNLTGSSFFGEFKELGGGINYRRGITQELTLGTGLVVDSSMYAMGELFYQPNNVPLQLGISTLVNPQLQDADYTAYFNYQPTDKLNLNFNGNGFSHNLRIDWRAAKNLSFRLGNDNRDNITTGFTFSKSYQLGEGTNQKQFSLLTSFDYGDRQGFSRRVDSRYSAFNFSHQGDHNATFSRLSYYLSNNSFNSQGHSLFVGYDTRNSDNNNSVVNFGWHYRSERNASDGGSLWDVELGYGFNAVGSAPLAALTTRAIPGTTLRLSYEGISPEDNDSQLRIDVFPNLRLQGRPSLGDRNPNKLRTQGGILVRPFADLNSNGKLDRGEKIYTEDAELLLMVNHKSLESIRKDITSQGVFVRLAPGEYRLDLDPAGHPFNLNPTESAYAVWVTAGSYTKIDVPFNRSYTAIGTVTNKKGEPVAGARVRAVSKKSDKSVLSVTNSAGVYFLEGLTQDTYSLEVGDRPVNVKPLTITPDSEPLLEIDLQTAN
ncbi:MAG: carboxypeptidase-like regulatory domain-containing protein [Cyanobacteria bacterium P01_A01_bin.83]